MKTVLIIIGVSALVLIGGVWLSSSSRNPDPNIISRNGLHTHPQLEIYVKGQRQDIPANIGVGGQYASMPTYDQGMRMTAMHTHEPGGTIHLEFPATVTKEDIRLGNFFRIWGKNFMEFGSSVNMMVNGTSSTELEKYEMQDGDKIELRYE